MKFLKLFSLTITLVFIVTLTGYSADFRKLSLSTQIKSVTLKKITISSQLLNKVMKANIYLPPNYSKARKYPVLYILPGSSGDENFCMPGLKIQNIANELINTGKLNPLIIVSPEMDDSFGLNTSKLHTQTTIKNQVYHLGRYEDYLTKELVGYIDSHYNTLPTKAGRYIGGISDGGYIAVRTALLHPGEYSKVGGHSPNLDHENPNPKVEALYFSDKQNNKDIYYLAKNSGVTGLSIYLDCGDKDTHKFYLSCNKLYKLLLEKHSKVEYHLNPGTHGNAYWEGQIPSYLEFYSGK